MKPHPVDRKGFCEACNRFALRVDYHGHQVCRSCQGELEAMLRAQAQDAEIMGNVPTFDDRVGDRLPLYWKRRAEA